MPPLSPVSVNFVYLQSLSLNLLGLSKLKSIPSSFISQVSPSPFSPFSLGPPLSGLSFTQAMTPSCLPPPSQSQDSSLLTDEESIFYQLCFRTVSYVGRQDASLQGFGFKPTNWILLQREGKKIFLSKAQSRAAMDVVAGRQLSISGALRALPTPEGFSK
jgi:hypothetical protein